jgi:hypothetical protein
LARLIVSGDDFQTFIAWLDSSLAEQDVRNRTLEGVQLHRGQGRSQLLDELVQLLKAAPKVVREMRDRS